MDEKPVSVPVWALLDAEQQSELFALFALYPDLLSDDGVKALAYLANNIVSNEQGERFVAIHALAWACRNHGSDIVAHVLERTGIPWIHVEFEGYWPMLMFNLGVTYLNGEFERSGRDVERAIGCFHYVIDNYAERCSLEVLSNSVINLGRALLVRGHGDPKVNAEEAVAYFQTVCNGTSITKLPMTWAEANAELGTALANRAGDLNGALRCYRRALKVYTPERDWSAWVRAQANLANALLRRRRSEADTERAIKSLRVILRFSNDDARPVPGSVLMDLGKAFVQRRRGSYAANREHAITYLTRALHGLNGEKPPAAAWCNLGIAHRDRIRGDRAADIERAIQCFKNSLACQDGARDPDAWASTQTHLAQAYLLRRRESRSANIEAAIGCARDAVERAEAHAGRGGIRSAALNALGMAYMLRQLGNDETNGQEAIRRLEAALALVSEQAEPSEWAKAASNLGVAYISWTGGDPIANREIGIGYLERAAGVLDGRAADPAQAVNLWNLGVALLARCDGPSRARRNVLPLGG